MMKKLVKYICKYETNVWRIKLMHALKKEFLFMLAKEDFEERNKVFWLQKYIENLQVTDLEKDFDKWRWFAVWKEAHLLSEIQFTFKKT